MGGCRWEEVADHPWKPHVHPIRTPAGACLTRVEPPDHPWHRGLWFVVKFVDGDNYWEELEPCGRQRRSPDGTIDWVAPDGTTVVLRERRTLTEVDLDPTAYAIDVAVDLTPERTVVLDRTEFTTWGGYGGLAFRGRGDWTDTALRTPDGAHERLVGRPAPWCDLTGIVDGTTGGITFMDHPANPGSPVPWYASTRAATYGDDGWSNFLNAAFLWDGPMTAEAGVALRFRYRLVVHDGPADAEVAAARHAAWTAGLTSGPSASPGPG